MTPKSKNGGPPRKRTTTTTGTTTHAEAPACAGPAWALALASYFCWAFCSFVSATLSSCLASSSFVSASLRSWLTSSAFVLLVENSCSHCPHSAATTSPSAVTALSALTTAFSALSRARRAAARSCQPQGCFPVRLPFAKHICLRFWLEPRSPELSSAAARPAPAEAKATVCNGISKSRSANQQHARRPWRHLRPSLWSAQRRPAPRHPAEQLSMRNPSTHTGRTNKPGLIFVVPTFALFRRLLRLRCPGTDTHSVRLPLQSGVLRVACRAS